MVCCEILSPTCKKVYSIHEGPIYKSLEKHDPSIHEIKNKKSIQKILKCWDNQIINSSPLLSKVIFKWSSWLIARENEQDKNVIYEISMDVWFWLKTYLTISLCCFLLWTCFSCCSFLCNTLQFQLMQRISNVNCNEEEKQALTNPSNGLVFDFLSIQEDCYRWIEVWCDIVSRKLGQAPTRNFIFC